MINLLLSVVVILVATVMALGISVRRLREDVRQGRLRAVADLEARVNRLEAACAASAGTGEGRDLAAMVDGVASVGMRLESRIFALEAAQVRPPSRASSESTSG